MQCVSLHGRSHDFTESGCSVLFFFFFFFFAFDY